MHLFRQPLPPLSMIVLLWLAMALHTLPILLADMPYFDDYGRALLLNDHAWLDEGRPGAQWLFNLLSFSASTPDLYPLPLLLASAVMACALLRLARQCFDPVQPWHALVVLPLWYSPMCLSNLTYHYDGAAMVLALALMVYAACTPLLPAWRAIWRGGVLIGVALLLYQPALNGLLGLYCLLFIRQLAAPLDNPLPGVIGPGSLPGLPRALVVRLGQLLTGLALYVVATPRLGHNPRSAALAQPLELAAYGRALEQVSGHLALLLTPASSVLLALLLASAAWGYWQLAAGKTRRRFAPVAAWWAFYLCLPVMMVLAVPGMMLLFPGIDIQARTLMGLGPALVALCYLSQLGLRRWWQPSLLLLALILLWTLSLSYLYGRVLSSQKALGDSIVQAIAEDILRRPALRDADHLYIVLPHPCESWLPAAHETLQRYPVLRYLMPTDCRVLPEQLRWPGVNQVLAIESQVLRMALTAHPQAPLVDHRFYDLYAFGNSVFIDIKPMPASQEGR